MSPAEPPPPVASCPSLPSNIGLWLVACAAALLAFCTRWPYVGESLWVDELHSAWSVWGDFGEVAQRAAWGNQTPVYYWALWLWRQVAGNSEPALRASSVILASLACGTLAAGVARCSQSLIGGLAAGVMFATDPNAIFFGTELRVFSAVMLLGVIACWSWLERSRSGRLRAELALFAAIILAALVQPTSLGVLGWLCISGRNTTRLLAWSRRSRIGIRRGKLLLFGLAILVCAGIAWWLAGRVLLNAWQHRDQWAAFATADSPWQLWSIWRWTPLLILPAAVASCLTFIAWFRGQRPDPQEFAWLRPALLVFVATLFFWLLSACGIVAVFHRRYLIAALPILIWAGGAAIGQANNRVQQMLPQRGRGAVLKWTPAVVVLLLSVVLVQGRLREAQQRPRLRGENWRSAAQYVAAQRIDDELVWLDPGLIETVRLLASSDPAALKYLAYPLSGPYNLLPVKIVNVRQPQREDDSGRAGSVKWAVLRCSRRSAQIWAERVASATDSFSINSFGGVQVVHFKIGTSAQSQTRSLTRRNHRG